MTHSLIKAYNSGANSELVTELVLDTTEPYDGNRVVVYSVPLDDIAETDIISFEGSFVITSDAAFLTRSVALMYIADSPTAVNGISVCQGYSENQNNSVAHHQRFHLDGNWAADQNYFGKHLNMVAFAAANSAGEVIVEQGYGRLSALHFRGEGVTIDDPNEQDVYMYATGGTVTEIGDYRIHTFTADDDFEVLVKGDTGNVERLLTGAGGGGANSGGGAGEYVHGVISLDVGVYPVVIGQKGLGGAASATGGNDATDGGNSTFAGDTALGGAAGVRGGSGQAGKDGGCGSGAGAASGGLLSGGASLASDGIGNAGGSNGNQASPYPSGGGGGASQAGGNGTSGKSGNGGNGIYNAISGTNISYCDGGAGSNYLAGGTAAIGGNGNGGAGRTTAGNGHDATENTGSGGGGAISGSVGGDAANAVLTVKYRFK